MTTSTQPYLDKWMYNPRSSFMNILNTYNHENLNESNTFDSWYIGYFRITTN